MAEKLTPNDGPSYSVLPSEEYLGIYQIEYLDHLVDYRVK